MQNINKTGVVKFGMPILSELSGIEENARACSLLGLDFLELNMNFPQYQAYEMDADYFNGIAEKYGIYYTIHVEEKFDICSFNKIVSNAYEETLKQTLQLAKKLKATVVNLHMPDGIRVTLPNKKIYLYDEYNEHYLCCISQMINMCEEELAGTNIKVCVENTDWKGKEFIFKALEILMHSDVFGITFDIGHNAAAGGNDEKVILNYANANKLLHMHAHGAKGKANHLPLGYGELNSEKYLQMAYKYKCSVVLETKTLQGLKESVEWLKTKNS